MRRAITFLATGAYLGRVPVASGTFGSVLAIPLLVALPALGLPALLQLVIIAGTVPLAMLVCHRACSEYEEADSGQIVLDEICGMLVAGALLAPSVRSLGLAFLVFRALDIVKPFPASYFDRHVKNGFGIVADDVCAGLYTNLVVRALS